MVSSGRGWSRATKLWDAARLLSQDEISGGNCECIAVRVGREGRKHPREGPGSVCLRIRQKPHGSVQLD